MFVKKIMIIILSTVFIYTFINLKPEGKISSKKIYLEEILSQNIKNIFNVDLSKWGQNGYGYEESKRKNKKTILYFYKKRDLVSNKFDRIVLANEKFRIKTYSYFKVEIDVLHSKEEEMIAKLYNIKNYPTMLVGSFDTNFKAVSLFDSNNNLNPDVFYKSLKDAKKYHYKVKK